ncbi:collagen-like protein [Ruminococcus sp. AF42-10]|nr:collagen-like protein [Ruminococcus sp. AF42-10]RGF40167.1 collagen-like protein [Ruminococcus sp. AF42-10]
MIIRHLGIDCAYINKVLEPITQREHGVTEFEIEIQNHGADIDLSECTLATYYGLKPDEHKVGVECRVDKDKGLIYLPLYLQMTTAEGVLKGILELQFPEGNVRFSGVNFKVSFAPDDTKVESTDDFNILENFISKPTTDGVVGQVLSIDNDGNTIWRTLKEFDGDYAHLSNRPSINGVELNGDKSLEDLNIKQTYTADDIPFADGKTFQQKLNNGELKGQDGVSGADGITPHIGDNGNWFIGETDTNKPSQGTNGVNGNDGVGVAKSEVNTSGELVITYSNGDSTNLGKIVGKDGLDGTNGQNGLSAYEIAKNGGFIGTEEDWLKSLKGADGAKGEQGEQGIQGIQGEKGQNGKDGTNGTNGKDGIGITNAEINNSGELILTYSNGTSANLGKVVGADLSNEVEDIKAYIGYTDEDIAGLCVDYENKTFKRLAGAVNLSQGADFDKFTMYGGRKRCNVSDDGTILAYYGDENYAEDGSNGQVMVFQPAFYYKIVPIKLEKNSDSGIGYHIRKANYYVSARPKTGFKLHPAFYDANGNVIDYILYSAYEGSMYDSSTQAYINDNVDESIAYEDGDLLCSVAGKKPISGLRKGIGTKSNLELMAQNRGAGWHLETTKATNANQLLMMVELGMMNSQRGIGQGVVNIPNNASYNCSSLTGSTVGLGNSTGQAKETINEIGGTKTTYNVNDKVSVSYRGIENPWGNIAKQVQGINIWGDGTMAGGQPYVANDFVFNEWKHSDNYEPVGFTLPNANGFIKAMGYGSENYDWLLIPSEIGGTSALPVGDYLYITQNLNGTRITQCGGGWQSGINAGSFYQIFNGSTGGRSRSAGGRLLYVPTAKV